MIGVFKKDKKDEDGSSSNIYANLEKTSVLQDTRLFNETPVNLKKCSQILTKILYLSNQGEQLTTVEATGAFFAMTKLFQCKDIPLRRLVYLGIKELAPIAEDIIMVTCILQKDMTGQIDLRAAAIRTLCSVIDAKLLQAIERFMKQAIVDKMPSISSAALVSSLHLMRSSSDLIKRWVNEVQETLNSDSPMVQFHALGLLYQIRKIDRFAVIKFVTKLVHCPPRSPFAVCILIRIASKLVNEGDVPVDSPLVDFISSCIRHKSDVVVYEASRAIVGLPNSSSRDIMSAVSVLQLFCSNSKVTLRFAAVRTLSKIAVSHPVAVSACNLDLENLISDSNRSVATLAITTLLKTGAESSVDRFMKQISSFISEIGDEFKIVVVQAVRALCMKFPRKNPALLSFLSSLLREEGGLEYKAAIADVIIMLLEESPEAKEVALAHLCEFIEDCEHYSLAVRILHLLGEEGPRTKQPSRYVRFIYNRIILENPTVRAAAVSTLARFGVLCDDLQPCILVLLKRCQMDPDDEVRDRATFFHILLDQQQRHLWNKYIVNGLHVSIVALENALLDYCDNPKDEPFDLHSVPVVSEEQTEAKPTEIACLTSFAPEKPTLTRQDVFAQKLSSISEFNALGPLFKSSQPQDLTEQDTEYTVQCIRHVFASHIVLQFDCTNTLNDQLLENVQVHLELGEDFKILHEIPCVRLEHDSTDICYILLSIPNEIENCTGVIPASLKFKVRDCDPLTGQPDSEEGYEDEYMLEDVELSLADHMQRITKSDFLSSWVELGDQMEKEDIFSLMNLKNISEAVKNICQFLGMQPCERSDKVQENKSSHTLLLAGLFRGGFEVLAQARLVLSEFITMQLAVRCSHPDVTNLIISSISSEA